MVWELNDFSLSQTIVLAFGKIFKMVNKATLTSTIERVSMKTATANFENLSIQVTKLVLSVVNMSICRISPGYSGIGV